MSLGQETPEQRTFMKTIYENGIIVTMDPNQPQAQSLVTEGDKILAIGSQRDMFDLAGPGCKVVDLQQGVLFPGFNETHNHLSWYAIFKTQAFLGNCRTIADIVKAIANHYENTDSEVLRAYGYDDTGLLDGREITRQDLDQACSDKPVVVMHVSAHVGFLNTKALEFYNITSNRKPPAGGTIHFDEQGLPTGRLDEHAWFEIAAKSPVPGSSDYKILLKAAIKDYNSQGFTGVHDAGLGLEDGAETVISSYKELEAENELNLKVFISAISHIFDKLHVRPLKSFTSMLTIGGVKLFLDGSIQVETAALKEPYLRRPDWRGEFIMDGDEFSELVEKYHCAGHHISIHGNGDAAIEKIITAVEQAQRKCSLPSRHMLIHCQTVSKKQLLRMRGCGMVPSFFAMHIHHWGDRHANLFLGEERAQRINPVGEAEAMGLPFTLHVDTPVRPVQALHSIHTAVNRVTSAGKQFGGHLCCTPYSAVCAYTSMAAYCSRSEQVRGTLSPGKYADMVLLSKDITSCPKDTIKDTSVWMTISNGRLVYES
ncbi:MAG: amidohydrolase [Desulfobulbaceae bacterium]|nr:amidohydrolase [Desulfobulbaceae bacterium]